MIVSVVPILRLRRATGAWSYKVPHGKTCQPGSLVIVPFRGRKHLGVVWEIEKDNEKATESVEEILTTKPLVRAQHRAYIGWLSESGFISLSTALHGWLPTALRGFPLTKATHAAIRNHDAWEPSAAHLALHTQQVVLTPSQRPQSSALLQAKYPEEVVDTFGKQGAQEELSLWLDILYGKIRVIIGREKALSAPFLNLRHVLIQEPEDIAYYHEQLPYLSLVEAGQELGNLWSAQTTLRSYIPQEAANLLWPSAGTLGSAPLASVKIIDLHHEDILGEQLLTALRNLKPDQQALLLYNAHDRTVMNNDNASVLLPGIETLRKKLALALGSTVLPPNIIVDTRHMFAKLHKNVSVTAILSVDPLLNAQNFADTVHGWADIGHLLSYRTTCFIQTKQPGHPLLSSLQNNQFPSYCINLIEERKQNHLPPFATTVVCTFPTKEKVDELYEIIAPLLTSTEWQISHPFGLTWRKKEEFALMMYAQTKERLPRAVIIKLSALIRPWKVQRSPWFVV